MNQPKTDNSKGNILVVDDTTANLVQFLDILNRTIYRNAQRINPYKNLMLALLDYTDGTLSFKSQQIHNLNVSGAIAFSWRSLIWKRRSLLHLPPLLH